MSSNTAAIIQRNSSEGDDHNSSSLYYETYKPPFLPVLILVFPIMPLFWSYSVNVTKEDITFGYSYPLVAKTIKRTQIKDAVPLSNVNGLTQWGGWGIRMRYGGSQQGWEYAYLPKNGDAVKLIVHNEENGKDSIYVFSCNEPKRVADILTSQS
jgi:hypothetical protein